MTRCKAHLYIRKKTRAGSVYKCTRCPSYVSEQFVDGNMAECHYCNKEFMMEPKLHKVKPHCGCRFMKPFVLKKRKTDNEEAHNEFLDDLVRKL